MFFRVVLYQDAHQNMCLAVQHTLTPARRVYRVVLYQDAHQEYGTVPSVPIDERTAPDLSEVKANAADASLTPGSNLNTPGSDLKTPGNTATGSNAADASTDGAGLGEPMLDEPVLDEPVGHPYEDVSPAIAVPPPNPAVFHAVPLTVSQGNSPVEGRSLQGAGRSIQGAGPESAVQAAFDASELAAPTTGASVTGATVAASATGAAAGDAGDAAGSRGLAAVPLEDTPFSAPAEAAVVRAWARMPAEVHEAIDDGFAARGCKSADPAVDPSVGGDSRAAISAAAGATSAADGVEKAVRVESVVPARIEGQIAVWEVRSCWNDITASIQDAQVRAPHFWYQLSSANCCRRCCLPL